MTGEGKIYYSKQAVVNLAFKNLGIFSCIEILIDICLLNFICAIYMELKCIQFLF